MEVHAFPASELSRRGFRRIAKQKILMRKALLFRAEASKDIGAKSRENFVGPKLPRVTEIRQLARA